MRQLKENTVYRETLLWILDEENPRPGIWDEEMNRRRIAFVHSLGLKCDSVGWCELDLGAPEAATVLAAIEDFCRADGWRARGWYNVEYQNPDCEWYELITTSFRDNVVAEVQSFIAENGQEGTTLVLNAYRESCISPKERGWIYVPARFRDACEACGVTDVSFAWQRDKGKYAAESYFAIYPSRQIAHIGVDWKMRTKEDVVGADVRRFYPGGDKDAIAIQWKYRSEDRATVDAMGGWLARIAEVFYELNIRLPACYPAAALPAGGMVLAHHDRNICRRWLPTCQVVLIHRDLARAMIEKKGLSDQWLRPALVVDELPIGYISVEATPPPVPSAAYIEDGLRAYEKHRSIPRPTRAVTEKETLSALRRAKKERREDFAKPLSAAHAAALEATPYAPLIALYRISDGGALSDEYELLSHAAAAEENAAFQSELAQEELLPEPPRGVVIGRCPDGDRLLLCDHDGACGTVLRLSHEEPAVSEEWKTLWQFVYEALTEIHS